MLALRLAKQTVKRSHPDMQLEMSNKRWSTLYGNHLRLGIGHVDGVSSMNAKKILLGYRCAQLSSTKKITKSGENVHDSPQTVQHSNIFRQERSSHCQAKVERKGRHQIHMARPFVVNKVCGAERARSTLPAC